MCVNARKAFRKIQEHRKGKRKNVVSFGNDRVFTTMSTYWLYHLNRFKIRVGAGEMAWQIRVLVALAKDWDRILSTTWWLTVSVTPVSESPPAF